MGVDPVVYRHDSPLRYADDLDEPPVEVMGDRDEAVHERSGQTAQPVPPATAAIRIVGLTAVLAMDHYGHSREASRQDGVKSAPVPRMDHIRPEAPEETGHPRYGPEVKSRTLAEAAQLDVGGQAGGQRSAPRHRDDGVPDFAVQRLDQVHDSVFGPADRERVQHVDDVRPGHRSHHRRAHSSKHRRDQIWLERSRRPAACSSRSAATARGSKMPRCSARVSRRTSRV